MHTLRPKVVSIGCFFLFCSMMLNIAMPLYYRELYGDGWVIYFAIRLVASSFALPFLVVLYLGKGWTRHIFLVIFALFVGRLFVNLDSIYQLEFFSVGAFLTGFVALVCWYNPVANVWFTQGKSQHA